MFTNIHNALTVTKRCYTYRHICYNKCVHLKIIHNTSSGYHRAPIIFQVRQISDIHLIEKVDKNENLPANYFLISQPATGRMLNPEDTISVHNIVCSCRFKIEMVSLEERSHLRLPMSHLLTLMISSASHRRTD